MPTTWKPFPLYVLSTDEGEFLLPTEMDLEASTEAINRLKSDLLYAKLKQERDSLQKTIEYSEFRHKTLLDKAEELKSDKRVTSYKFELLEPGYVEYQQLKEQATDWVTGEPRLNGDRLGTLVLPGRVKLDGKELDSAGIGGLSPMLGEALWRRMQTMIYPNPERLPFLRTLWPT